MVVKEVSVGEGETAFVAVVAREIVSVVSLSAFCSLWVALHQLIVTS